MAAKKAPQKNKKEIEVIYRLSDTPKEERERKLARAFDFLFELTLERMREEGKILPTPHKSERRPADNGL